MAMIEVSGVVKAFGGKRALDGATLSVAEGEAYGLAGRNGAGKSTLVRTVMGAYRPDAGSVLVGGRDLVQFDGTILISFSEGADTFWVSGKPSWPAAAR